MQRWEDMPLLADISPWISMDGFQQEHMTSDRPWTVVDTDRLVAVTISSHE
jgi:hypothetical protein